MVEFGCYFGEIKCNGWVFCEINYSMLFDIELFVKSQNSEQSSWYNCVEWMNASSIVWINKNVCYLSSFACIESV
jgi:hypothetical protein